MDWSKSSDYSIDSACGRYRISRGKSGGVWIYHLWRLNANKCRYTSGTSKWGCISVHRSAPDAKAAAEHHKRTGKLPA